MKIILSDKGLNSKEFPEYVCVLSCPLFLLRNEGGTGPCDGKGDESIPGSNG